MECPSQLRATHTHSATPPTAKRCRSAALSSSVTLRATHDTDSGHSTDQILRPHRKRIRKAPARHASTHARLELYYIQVDSGFSLELNACIVTNDTGNIRLSGADVSHAGSLRILEDMRGAVRCDMAPRNVRRKSSTSLAKWNNDDFASSRCCPYRRTRQLCAVVLQDRSVACSLTDSLLLELWDCLSDYEASSDLGARLRRAFASALHAERVLESVDETLVSTSATNRSYGSANGTSLPGSSLYLQSIYAVAATMKKLVADVHDVADKHS